MLVASDAGDAGETRDTRDASAARLINRNSTERLDMHRRLTSFLKPHSYLSSSSKES